MAESIRLEAGYTLGQLRQVANTGKMADGNIREKSSMVDSAKAEAKNGMG